MASAPENPNLRRRPGPGVLVRLGILSLKPWLWLLGKRRWGQTPLTLFQSYLVGDLYLALPALKKLGRAYEVLVICRPDCLEILRAEGLKGIPFDNAFFIRPGIRSFLSTLGQAWGLRGKLGNMALDFDADPRSAFWLRLGGIRRVASYARPYAGLFHRTFPLPPETRHQADKNLAVAQGMLDGRELVKGMKLAPAGTPVPETRSIPLLDPATAPWVVSCWTRKDAKNWPLEHWNALLEKMNAARLPMLLLDAPDGDAAFRAFLQGWSGKIGILRGSLAQIAGHVQASGGAVTTDNFLGHMAGYYGKPVLWINGSSDPAHVMPRGPRTASAQVDPMACRPCHHRCVNPKYKDCLNSLHPEQVWKVFEELRRPPP